jgi:large subunit ribosomal protein L25
METKAKKLRREGYVVGNLFGKEIEGSIPLQIDKKEAEKLHKECLKGSQLYLELEGKKYDVLLKDVQYNAMNRTILEMEFQALVQGEKVHSVSEIVLHNKDKVTEGILEQLLKEVSYKALPEDLVDKIDVDCSNLKLGDSITVADLDIAKNSKVDISTSLDSIVVTVIASKNNVVEEETAEGEETEKDK